MPPKAKFTKEQIVSAALDLIRENGIFGQGLRTVRRKRRKDL